MVRFGWCFLEFFRNESRIVGKLVDVNCECWRRQRAKVDEIENAIERGNNLHPKPQSL